MNEMNDINKKELRAIAKQILKEPRRLRMNNWVDTRDSIAPCGTVACIAGHAILRDKMRKNKFRWAKAGKNLLESITGNNTGDYYDPEKEAGGLLGLTPTQTKALFYVAEWPEKFLNSYQSYNYVETTGNRRKRAEITAKRIEHFIETGE